MTISQEDAFYDFLENVTEPFTAEDVVVHIRKHKHQKTGRLALEITSFLDARKLAFPVDAKTWISRRGCFERVPFVISPTRLELLNGILIPGHRCLPFANPVLFPQEYLFYWNQTLITVTTIEGSPEEFYPYYSIYGEEYAPQYVARDNPENEAAFNYDPYDDPLEVSIQALDMRNIYRESSFVPGDRFMVRTLNWKEGKFELLRVGKDQWSVAALEDWCEAAEQGFKASFERFGPGNTTEEQIAFAYWYGGERMRDVPAYSLEDFLYDKTKSIEITTYGIETRFWYAGKEIPDHKHLEEQQSLPDRSMIEDLLYKKRIPVSEYVVLAYVRDALFRHDPDISRIIERIIPPVLGITEREWHFLAGYIVDALDEIKDTYSLFTDTVMGPLRQRVGELHTAVLDLTARLQKGDIDASCLPKHTFIILSQIQGHAAGVLEDLSTDEGPSAVELEAMDNSLDSMIETYEDIKELIDEALDNFRRNHISVVKPTSTATKEGRIIQAGIGGTDVWRRIVIPETYRLEDLHRILQTVFGWKALYGFRFLSPDIPAYQTASPLLTLYGGTKAGRNKQPLQEEPGLDLAMTVEDLSAQGITEFSYEYGTLWNVKIIILSRLDIDSKEPIRCIAGAGAAPPESIDGPIRFRKYVSILEKGSFTEQQKALHELGQDFDPETFDMDACNQRLKHM
ncbi:MAG: plasmid pRiA4b ORF-3 family protein [Treponema sp.]|nr:plasmid pRiA4b ORF-3 family protein [Treponema sp.]